MQMGRQSLDACAPGAMHAAGVAVSLGALGVRVAVAWTMGLAIGIGELSQRL